MTPKTYAEKRAALSRSRRATVRAMRGRGMTLQAIADRMGVSKQRVHQILNGQ